MIPVILGVTILIFTIMYFIPGDPVKMMLGQDSTPAQVAAKRQELGLNDSYLIRLGKFVGGIVLHFDFGDSWVYHKPVTTELLHRLPRTLTIAAICIMLQILVGTPLGIIAAVNQNGWGDRISTFIALLRSFPAQFLGGSHAGAIFLGAVGLAATLWNWWNPILYPSLYRTIISGDCHASPADSVLACWKSFAQITSSPPGQKVCLKTKSS